MRLITISSLFVLLALALWTHEVQGSSLRSQQRVQRAGGCKKKFDNFSRSVVRDFCLIWLHGQHPQPQSTVSPEVTTLTTLTATSTLADASTQTTLAPVTVTVTDSTSTSVIRSTLTETDTNTESVTTTTTTTETATITANARRRRSEDDRAHSLLAHNKRGSQFFSGLTKSLQGQSKDIITDACLLFLYGSLTAPASTLPTSTATRSTTVTTTVGPLTTKTSTVTPPATTQHATTTTTTTAQVTTTQFVTKTDTITTTTTTTSTTTTLVPAPTPLTASPGFEDIPDSDLYKTDITSHGWTLSGQTTFQSNTANAYNTPYGANFVVIYGVYSATNSLSTPLSLQVGRQYTLNYAATIFTSFRAGFCQLQITIGDGVQAITLTPNVVAGQWSSFSQSFTATQANPLLRFICSGGMAASERDYGIDQVSLTLT